MTFHHALIRMEQKMGKKDSKLLELLKPKFFEGGISKFFDKKMHQDMIKKQPGRIRA